MVFLRIIKNRVILTVKERALIALTFKKLDDSPSEIAKELGAVSEQISRDIYKDLINEGLVEKNKENGKLMLTKVAKREPLVGIILETRDLGKKLMVLGALIAIASLVGTILGIIRVNLSDLVDQEYFVVLTGFILSCLFIRFYLYEYPKLLLRRVKKELTEVSKDRSSDT